MKVALVTLVILALGVVILYAIAHVVRYLEDKRIARMTPSEKRKYQEEMYKLHQWHDC